MNYFLQSFKLYLNEERKAQIRRDRLVCAALGLGFAICAMTGTTRKGAITLGIGFALGSVNGLMLWAMTS